MFGDHLSLLPLIGVLPDLALLGLAGVVGFVVGRGSRASLIRRASLAPIRRRSTGTVRRKRR